MTIYMKRKWIKVKSCRAYKKVVKVVNKIQEFNDRHRHILYIVSLVLSFLFNQAKIAEVESSFEEKDIVRQEQLAHCRTKTAQLEESLHEHQMELDAWKLAAFMYTGQNPEDSLFYKAINSLMEVEE